MLHLEINCWSAGQVFEGEADQYVTCDEALWTLDISQETWQRRRTSGPAPLPAMALGIAVVNDCLYVLTNQAASNGNIDYDAKMNVYELDMRRWHWRLLPCQGQLPGCVIRVTPVVVQVRVLAL